MKAGPILETVLYAEDLAATRTFYESLLGLNVAAALPGRFVFFRHGQQMLLVFNPKATLAQAGENTPPAHGASGPGHVCFRADAEELLGWRTLFAKLGIAIDGDMEWPGGGRSLYIRDPAGNSVEFAEPRIWGLAEMPTLRNRKIVIATHNKGKLEEFAQLLTPYGVETVSAGQLGLAEPEETESSFIGNARIKAQAALKATGMPVIADDSGLCVDALDGAPGVYTANWAGPNRDWMLAMQKVEDRLQEVRATTGEKRGASFNCTLVVLWPDGAERIFEGVARGTLTWPTRGALGHGYDPMFVPEGQPLTFAEMTAEDKNRRSHRALALEKLTRELF
jgi:XTP/dITP diphosphohydrolase